MQLFPLGSHRLLYCVIIIISWHIWKSIFCFLNVSSIVSTHENPREEIQFAGVPPALLHGVSYTYSFPKKGIYPWEREMWIEKNPQLCTETGFYLCRSSTHQCKAVSPTDLPVFSKHPYYKSTSWAIESSCYLGGISTSQFSQGKRRRIWDVLQLRMNVKYLIFTHF